MLVLFAITATAMLGVIGLLYSFGLVLAQRRTVQAAVDAASLGGTWQVLSQLQSGLLDDTSVSARVAQLITSNGVNASTISAAYVNAAGLDLVPAASVGGHILPPEARGVRVTASSTVATILPNFVQIPQVLVRDTATATLRPTASLASMPQVVPLAVSASDVLTGATYKLFKNLTNGQPPTLNFGPAGAPSTGVLATDLQYWSDGQHTASWSLVAPSVPWVGSAHADAITAGLLDNVRRQKLVDASGRFCAVISVPVYNSLTSTSVNVAGFAQLRVCDDFASTGNAVFVPYSAGGAVSSTTFSGTDLGAVFVQLRL